MVGKHLSFTAFTLLLISYASAAETAWQVSCQQAVADVERSGGTPARLLRAVSLVESGRRDPRSGAFEAWPWTINAQGQGHFYESKAEAIEAARTFQALGITSIDVGCMQINLHHHPDAFSSLEEAFDPRSNVQYGARFLTNLHGQLQNWFAAVGAYHSFTPALGLDYARRVQQFWQGGDERISETVPINAIASLQNMAPVQRPFISSMISNSPPPRIIRHDFSGGGVSGAASGAHGRDLSSYRANPVRMAWQR